MKCSRCHKEVSRSGDKLSRKCLCGGCLRAGYYLGVDISTPTKVIIRKVAGGMLPTLESLLL